MKLNLIEFYKDIHDIEKIIEALDKVNLYTEQLNNEPAKNKEATKKEVDNLDDLF